MKGSAFHNTIHEPAQMTLNFHAAALVQEDVILETFRKINRPMAWFEVMACLEVYMNECSLKRAITNLCSDKRDSNTSEVTKRRALDKTKEKVTGPHGKPCYRYKLIDHV